MHVCCPCAHIACDCVRAERNEIRVGTARNFKFCNVEGAEPARLCPPYGGSALKLHLGELGVEAACRHELGMRALGHDAARLQHQNAVA
jgi:hypothetical protein